MSRHYSAPLALALLILSPIIHGWVMHSGRSHPASLVNDEKYLCPVVPSPTTKTKTSMFASTTEEEEVIEYLDDDDEDDENENDEDENDYDPQAALKQKAAWMEELVRLSKTSSTDPSAVESAQELFDAMFRAFVETDDATFFPTVEVYNLILETHAYSATEDGGNEAERILGKMKDPSNDFVARPNEETYLCVMDAWSIRKQPDKAKAVLEKQESPTVESYNKLIQAYGKSGDFDAAESLFRSLLEDETANHRSWVQLMKARESCETDSEETVETYFQEMEDEGFEARTDAYNVLLRFIGRNDPDGFQKAEAIMYKMIAGFRGGDANQKPNPGTFRAVLGAYYKQGPRKLATSSSAAKVEQLLQFMEAMMSPSELLEDSQSSSDVTRIYKMAVEIIGWSKDSKKAVKANRILRKQQDGGFVSSPLDLYVSVLKACASTTGNSKGKFEAFQVALGAVKDLRQSPDQELALTSSVMGLFLQCCHKLMPDGEKRDSIVTKVFQECSEKGLVNDFVLNEFEAATSEGVQLEVLGGFSVDGASIPESWSRNVVV